MPMRTATANRSSTNGIQAQPREHGDAEVAIHERAVRLDDREPEDEEAPEDEGVRQPGDRPREQAALSDDLGHLGLEHRAGIDVSAESGLAAADQAPEPVQAAAGDRQSGDGHEEAEDEAEAHAHTLDPTGE